MSEPREAYLGADLGGTHFRLGLRLRGELQLLDQETVAADAAWEPGVASLLRAQEARDSRQASRR